MGVELKKEWLFSTRSGKVFILLMSILFLAVLTPIMLKAILPEILLWQFPEMPQASIDAMINASQQTSITGFLSDLFELGLIIIVFTLGGSMALELSENTLVFPLISNKKIPHIVLSKVVYLSGLLALILMVSILVNYAYAGLLFAFDVKLLDVLLSGLLMSLYFMFVIANIIFWGVLLKRSIPASFMSLLVCYLVSVLSGLFNIHQYTPSGLVNYASTLTFSRNDVIMSVVITSVIIIILVVVSIKRVEKMELNTR